MISLLLPIIYLSFISLGLPDALLGSAWPMIYQAFGVPISSAGIISGLISLMTIVSSLMSDRLTKKLGSGGVTAGSVVMTAVALFGFSISRNFISLVLWAIPYGLGAGSVDAALNNYVALHYKSKHMSWLHFMWGIGATGGPWIMSYAISSGKGWNAGYRYVSFIQIVLSIIVVLSLPLWAKSSSKEDKAAEAKALSLAEVLRIPGAKEVAVMFLSYCALEQTTGLWAATYLTKVKDVAPEEVSFLASAFYLGITVGRFLSGFLTMKFSDDGMINIGKVLALTGIVMLFIPSGPLLSTLGFLVIGLGCAPIYPSIIHSTPDHFGRDKSQALIGIQMASAYTGSFLAPPLFGVIAERTTAAMLPLYALSFCLLIIVLHVRLQKKTKQNTAA